jgi:hypothetical protein
MATRASGPVDADHRGTTALAVPGTIFSFTAKKPRPAGRPEEPRKDRIEVVGLHAEHLGPVLY